MIESYEINEISIADNVLMCGSDSYKLDTEEEKIIARRILRKNMHMKGFESEYNELIKLV